MRLGEIRETASRQSGLTPRGGEGVPATGSRALVVVAAASAAQQATANYRQAPFLAQLIAMKQQLPQTRERRRAEPQEALAAYRAAEALTRHH